MIKKRNLRRRKTGLVPFLLTIPAFLLALFVLLMTSTYAHTGDFAERQIHGFSPNGHYFAFEEFGIQDGSGFPYANLYLINTRVNKWVKGSPFRVLIKSETAKLANARAQVGNLARPLLERYQIRYRGRILGHNPVTETSAEPHVMTVAPGPQPFMMKDYPLTFSLTTYQIDTPRCRDYGPESQRGFALYVARRGQETQSLHTDRSIPKSRGCPKGYSLSDVIRYDPINEGGLPTNSGQQDQVVYVVIKHVFKYGFEGPDGRFLAGGYWLPRFNSLP